MRSFFDFIVGLVMHSLSIVLIFGSGLMLASIMFFSEDDWKLGNLAILVISALVMALGLWLQFRAQKQ